MQEVTAFMEILLRFSQLSFSAARKQKVNLISNKAIQIIVADLFVIIICVLKYYAYIADTERSNKKQTLSQLPIKMHNIY